MKIGILSDTHGNLAAVDKAACQFKNAGVGAVLHCGDIGGCDVLARLSAMFLPLDVPVYAVHGNVDSRSSDAEFQPALGGMHLFGRFGEVSLAGKKIALLHSDDRPQFHAAVARGGYDLVLTGHTHAVHDFKVGRTRCINPGTAGRGAPGTCAVLDLETGGLVILEC